MHALDKKKKLFRNKIDLDDDNKLQFDLTYEPKQDTTNCVIESVKEVVEI